MAGIAKSTTTPAHMSTLPVRSHRPDQASAVEIIKRFTVPSEHSMYSEIKYIMCTCIPWRIMQKKSKLLCTVVSETLKDQRIK